MAVLPQIPGSRLFRPNGHEHTESVVITRPLRGSQSGRGGGPGSPEDRVTEARSLRSWPPAVGQQQPTAGRRLRGRRAAMLGRSQVVSIDKEYPVLYDIRNRKEGCRMSEPTTISSKGQVTVPRDVRERLGLQAGDKIAWSMLSNGTIVLRPKTRRLADLVGILTQPAQPSVRVDDMRLPE